MRYFFSVLFFIFSLQAASGKTIYNYPETAPPGEIFSIMVLSDQKIDDFKAVLKTAGGKTLREFKGFSYAVSDITGRTALPIRCVIIPVSFDFTFKPGKYLISITGIENSAVTEHDYIINLTERKFDRTDIALNKSLSGLRTDLNDRRAKETRSLMNLFDEFNTDSIYIDSEMQIPLAGNNIITSTFGERRKFIYSSGGDSSSYHYGIDYAAAAGTPVYASGEGKIVFSGDRFITGNSVIIEHLPGLYSIYYHLQTLEAKTGDIIAKGAKIGTIGSTGLSTGPHLHWEIRNQSVPVDPLSMIESAVIDKDKIISIIDNDFSDKTKGR